MFHLKIWKSKCYLFDGVAGMSHNFRLYYLKKFIINCQENIKYTKSKIEQKHSQQNSNYINILSC